MICSLVENLVDLYVQGRLVAFEDRLVESHIESCGACAAEAATWRRTFLELESLPVPTAPANLKAALKSALAAAAAPKVSPIPDFAVDWRPMQAPSLALALGCAAFLISVSVSIFGSGPASQSCSDSPASVCITPRASQSAIIRGNP